MDHLSLDRYADLDSPLHRWDVRFKLIGMFSLIFAFSFVQELHLLPSLLLLTVVLFLVSRLPLHFLLTRLQYPGIFLLAVAIVLPLFSGSTILLWLGPLAIRQEGLLALIVIAVKFVCILTLGLVLFGSAPFLTTIKAMRALRLSPILADMMLLTYRYIFEIGRDLQSMSTAMRLRNFQANRFSLDGLRKLASLSGTLLVRSYERSERIYKAMIVRGYGAVEDNGIQRARSSFQANHQDALALAAMLLASAAIVVVEIWLGSK